MSMYRNKTPSQSTRRKDDTDDWIQKTLGSVPTMKPPSDEEAGLVNGNLGYGTDSTLPTTKRLHPKSFAVRLMKTVLYLINAILFIAGVSIVILGIIVGDRSEQRLVGATSDQVALIVVLTGVAFALFATFGLVAARTHNRCMLAGYILVLVVLTILLVALSVTLLWLVNSNKIEEAAKELWNTRVSDTNFLCQLQKDLKCSGFTSRCDLNGTRPADCPDCPDAADNAFEPCWPTLQDAVHANFKALMYVTTITCGSVLIAVIVSCCLCRRSGNIMSVAEVRGLLFATDERRL
eukprot:TRINITY_DN32486_c0_g1_i1.p1 TRINITY_DN32486_c0_g1~~TRINITY_DN32486_c0_g1_i1.p1  ORF type:complete len:293 (+),score=61.73 TRINITY_DN32486_c0_g1_i1:49-927(+)